MSLVIFITLSNNRGVAFWGKTRAWACSMCTACRCRLIHGAAAGFPAPDFHSLPKPASLKMALICPMRLSTEPADLRLGQWHGLLPGWPRYAHVSKWIGVFPALSLKIMNFLISSGEELSSVFSGWRDCRKTSNSKCKAVFWRPYFVCLTKVSSSSILFCRAFSLTGMVQGFCGLEDKLGLVVVPPCSCPPLLSRPMSAP